ncbi:MAG: helix-turn-helix domain-containing protein [Collinsella intestinalis]
MELRESDRMEFKLEVNERICKTVIAFANTLGGTIYVGIDDFGNPVGIPSDELDGEMLRLSNLIHDLVCPEIMQFDIDRTI